MNRSTLHTGVVSRDDAERRGAISVAEALEGEAGLQVNPGGYDYLGNPSGVQMQGLDAERVLILRDGERVVGDSGGVVDLANFAIQDVERVEYVFGPTSSLYGTGALGGVVNIISGPPIDDGTSARARVEGRSLPAGLLGATLSHRRDIQWLTASATLRRSAGVQGSPALPDLVVPHTSRTEFGLRAGRQDAEVNTVAQVNVAINRSLGVTSLNVPGLTRYVTDLPDDNHRVHIQLSQTYDLATGTQLRVSTSGQHFGGVTQKDRRDSPLDEERDRDQTLLASELVLTRISGPLTYVFGTRFEREAFHQVLRKTSLNRGEPETLSTHEVDPVLLQSGAAFAQLSWELNECFTILPGIRGEIHRNYGGVIAPRLAVAVRPDQGWLLRASAGRGFRVPTAKEFGFLFDHSTLGYRVIGNPSLMPEQSWGVQADVTHAVNRQVRLRIGGFHNWISSLIATNYVGQSALGVDDYSYVNVGSASTSGVDASAMWTLGSKLRAQLAYSHLYTLNRDLQQPLPTRPAHTLVTTLDYQAHPRVRITTRARGISEAFLTSDLRTPGVVRFDIRTEYAFASYVQAHVGVLDLLSSQRELDRPGDTRPLVGRMFYAGIDGQWPASEN